MSVIVQITLSAPEPVTVGLTDGGSSVTVAAALTQQAANVAVVQSTQPVQVSAVQSPQAVNVEVTEAQPGADGASFTPVILNTLADYLALPPEQQIDPTKIYGVRVQS